MSAAAAERLIMNSLSRQCSDGPTLQQEDIAGGSAIPVCSDSSRATRLFFSGFLREYCPAPHIEWAAGGRVDRHLIWPDLLNARDLGGLGSASGQETAWRRVVRADNLNK